jgi:hypothetical protein
MAKRKSESPAIILSAKKNKAMDTSFKHMKMTDEMLGIDHNPAPPEVLAISTKKETATRERKSTRKPR